MEKDQNIDPSRLPRHVAIIMDGNGRWAKRQGLDRIQGHQRGAESVRDIVRTARRIGIKYLTLYAFSEENWKRARYEIEALMMLLKRYLKSELQEMLENGIRFNTIGNIYKLPQDVQELLKKTKEKTSKNTNMVLTLALSYGGRQEICEAMRHIAKRVAAGDIDPSDIDEDVISGFLYTSSLPDPDLLIRTSGEMRISNFLLWQIAYTELYITPIMWPDFKKKQFIEAILEYQRRERRFGGI
ncbi:MAG TPA: isoprenyl transferase [Desulfobacteraceae bacterium]|nr:isoprenyl transferase [Desulfobacteraceae bacterium]